MTSSSKNVNVSTRSSRHGNASPKTPASRCLSKTRTRRRQRSRMSVLINLGIPHLPRRARSSRPPRFPSRPHFLRGLHGLYESPHRGHGAHGHTKRATSGMLRSDHKEPRQLPFGLKATSRLLTRGCGEAHLEPPFSYKGDDLFRDECGCVDDLECVRIRRLPRIGRHRLELSTFQIGRAHV